MKTLTTNSKVCELIFRLYLFLSRYGYSHSENNRVYDSLGVIDTLGDRREYTKYTYYYSDEFVSLFGIKLPFGYSLEYVNCEGKELKFGKQKIYMG